LFDLRLQELAKSGDIQPPMSRREERQIFFRESKQTHGRSQTPTVLRMQWLLEVFLQMNEGPSRLNQAFEKIIVVSVAVQPKLLENVVRFIVMLLVPALKICTVEWMRRDIDFRRIDGFTNKLLDEARNPLAFVHEGLNLPAAQMMGKPRGFIFSQSSAARSGGGEE
jgi:hypothetical protein